MASRRQNKRVVRSFESRPESEPVRTAVVLTAAGPREVNTLFPTRPSAPSPLLRAKTSYDQKTEQQKSEARLAAVRARSTAERSPLAGEGTGQPAPLRPPAVPTSRSDQSALTKKQLQCWRAYVLALARGQSPGVPKVLGVQKEQLVQWMNEEPSRRQELELVARRLGRAFDDVMGLLLPPPPQPSDVEIARIELKGEAAKRLRVHAKARSISSEQAAMELLTWALSAPGLQE